MRNSEAFVTRRGFLQSSLPLAAALAASRAFGAAARPAPRFYAYCVGDGVPGSSPRPVGDQARLLRELGFDGLGFELPLDEARLAANLKAVDDAGAQLFLCWATVNVNPDRGEAFNARLPQAINRLKGRPATVAVLLTGHPAGDPRGMAPAVTALRTLGDAAAKAGLRVSIYNHVDNWTESLPFVLEVVRRTDHPQIGFNFNLCHWLKVDAARDWRPLLRTNAAKLFCVTLNGATAGATTWTRGLIRPLDEGDFDTLAVVRVLEQIGYRGPVGLMCYGVPGEPREHLARSMKVWRQWHPGQ